MHEALQSCSGAAPAPLSCPDGLPMRAGRHAVEARPGCDPALMALVVRPLSCRWLSRMAPLAQPPTTCRCPLGRAGRSSHGPDAGAAEAHAGLRSMAAGRWAEATRHYSTALEGLRRVTSACARSCCGSLALGACAGADGAGHARIADAGAEVPPDRERPPPGRHRQPPGLLALAIRMRQGESAAIRVRCRSAAGRRTCTRDDLASSGSAA